jgi:TRAP-type mannitol/chloroaromatic compound transport system permease large subunit
LNTQWVWVYLVDGFMAIVDAITLYFHETMSKKNVPKNMFAGYSTYMCIQCIHMVLIWYYPSMYVYKLYMHIFIIIYIYRDYPYLLSHLLLVVIH